MGKATNFKFGRYIHRVHANKSPLKICEKMERGRIQGLPKFLEYPQLSQEWVKLRTSNLAGIFTGSINFKFCTHILSINRNKSPLQICGKVAGCVVRTLKTFQCIHILDASRGLLCDSSAVLYTKCNQLLQQTMIIYCHKWYKHWTGFDCNYNDGYYDIMHCSDWCLVVTTAEND